MTNERARRGHVNHGEQPRVRSSERTAATNRCKSRGRPEVWITLLPAKSAGRYQAYLDEEHEPLCVSRQPFLDSARKLLARGHDPRTMLVMQWAGSEDWALRGPLGGRR